MQDSIPLSSYLASASGSLCFWGAGTSIWSCVIRRMSFVVKICDGVTRLREENQWHKAASCWPSHRAGLEILYEKWALQSLVFFEIDIKVCVYSQHPLGALWTFLSSEVLPLML